MNEPSARPTRRQRIVLLSAILAVELAALACFVWPLAGAKLRAGPDRLNTAGPSARPANWARPMAEPGLRNLFQVNAGLYRGAPPTAEGARRLKEIGVRTVVNLEYFHSDRDALAGTGLNYVHIRSSPLNPEKEDVVAFLKVIADANLAPVYVHCMHGSDRTGTMCAVYRIAVEGWTKQQAIDEMVHGGYGFHPEWQNLLDFIDGLDVAAMKKQAGMTR